MTEWAKDAWAWARKAPPAAILAIVLILAAWVVYTQDDIHRQQMSAASERDVIRARAGDLEKKVDKANDKLDKLLEQLAQIRAAQLAMAHKDGKT